MRFTLVPHPDTPGPDIAIEAEAHHQAPGRLHLVFSVTGDIAALSLPPPGPVVRADELWRHSCFEAFLRPGGDAGYFELNLAPSRAWAAYRFTDYRMDMASAGGVPVPEIEVTRRADDYRLSAAVDLSATLGLLADIPWRLGLSAVIEEESGRQSLWALAHPPGKPDFHHHHCFAAELAAAKRA